MLINSQTSHRARVKVINDPIHGHFELPPHVLEVIDTPHVQRLRELKQLGGTYLVYPGAAHNRFEHSLGVSHLSAKLVTSLRDNPRTIHSSNPYDGNYHFLHTRRLLELAGLCHDLGHGPFSHLFDHMFLPIARLRHSANDSLWNQVMEHEQRSVKLFSHCVDKYSLDIDKNDINSIASLITGTRSSTYNSGSIPPFAYDVVANATNGVDTDKFDYIARDVYNIGLQSAYGFDHHRLIKFAKVIDDHICYHSKEVFNIYNMFLTRFQLHRTVYNHRAAISIDAMITDAFLEADSKLGISQSILDPADFLTMTDTILPIIERSKDSALAGARHIIHRLRRRQLYRFVDEILLPAGMSCKITPQEITTSQDVAGTGVNLVPDDIYVADVTLNFGMKEQNPVDKVRFFRDWDDNHTELISSTRASYIIPAHFQEKFIRVYIRRVSDEETGNQVKHAAQVAFHKLLRRLNLHSQLDTAVTAPRTRFGPNDLYDPDTEGSGENTSNETETERTRQGNRSVGSHTNERLAKRQKPNVGNEVDS